MNIRWLILIIGIAGVIVSACSEGGPSLVKHDTDNLVLFKRVTLAADAPDRAEIEVEVRTGSDFSKMAPNGTVVTLETSLGRFENNGRRIQARTVGGRSVNILILPEPSRLTVSARSGDAEALLVIDVNEDGSIQLDPS
jgi:hypothetical protein